MITIYVILTAIAGDIVFGEPRRFHPLVGFGNIAHALEEKLNLVKVRPAMSVVLGLTALIILLTPFTVLTYWLISQVPFAWVVEILIVYWAIGYQSLLAHAQRVANALLKGDTTEAKKGLAYMVSRNTDQLDETQITQATIESVLENGSDAIFAPLFWFVVAGAPAIVLYRLSNTLDAMWGYKNEQYHFFGCAAARFDDLLNYLPARLVAFSYCVLGNTRLGWHCWKTQAADLDSPNAGPVMTAGAGALGIKLGGPAVYHGKLKSKPYFGGSTMSEVIHIKRANNLIHKTLLLWIVVISLISFLVSLL